MKLKRVSGDQPGLSRANENMELRRAADRTRRSQEVADAISNAIKLLNQIYERLYIKKCRIREN